MGGLLALPVFLASPAAAQARSVAPACGNVPEKTFTDESAHGSAEQEAAIDCVAAYGVAEGKNDGRYAPADQVTREQMASFIARTLAKVNGLTLPAGGNKFANEPISADHRPNVERIAATNPAITIGYPDGTFKASRSVTRGEMATFMVRTLQVAGATVTPPQAGKPFPDVEENYTHEDAIDSMKQMGIVQGRTNGNYDPEGFVTRGEMAIFLSRLLAELVAQGKVTAVGSTAQAFNVSGGTETRENSATTSPTNPNTRTCTVAVPAGQRFEAAVFRTTDVTNTGGVLTFADANSDAQADLTPVAGIVIVNINGANTGAAEVNNSTSLGNNFITIASVGPAFTGDVTLVVWQDTEGLTADQLDLTPAANALPKTAREGFGIGCRTLFGPQEQAGGGFGTPTEADNRNVIQTAKDSNLFVACLITAGQPGPAETTDPATCRTYNYDANDVFVIGGNPQPAGQAGLDAFEAALSPDDDVFGTYATDAGGVSTINLVDEAPLPPANVTFTPTGTTFSIVITESLTPTADAYRLYEIVRPASGTCPDFTTAAGRTAFGNPVDTRNDPTPNASTGGTVTISRTGLQANTFYCYVVTTVDEGDDSAPFTNGAAGTTTGATSDTGAPRITDVRATEGTNVGNVVGQVDAGDTHRFIFNEAMAETTDDPGEGYNITDADSPNASIATVRCEVEDEAVAAPATTDCSLNTANVTINNVVYGPGRVLTVNIGTNAAGFTLTQAGTTPGVAYPATITNVTAGWDDQAGPPGNQLDLAGSPDKVIDVASFTTGP